MEQDLTRIAEWVSETCLLFGTEVSTAHRVAAIFVEGLSQDQEADGWQEAP